MATAVRQVFHRLLAIGENRFHLFMLEVEEERDRLLDKLFLAMATATLGLIGLMAWTAALVLVFWSISPIGILVGLGAAYSAAAYFIFRKLMQVHRRQPPFAGTIEQLQKDRACFK